VQVLPPAAPAPIVAPPPSPPAPPVPPAPPPPPPPPPVRVQPRITGGDPAAAFEFPERAQRRNIERGTATVEFTISASGAVSNPRLVSEDPEGAGFGQAALSGIRRLRFEPATVDGRAVESIGRYRVRFQTS